MGWRWRKRVKVAPGVSMNLSSKGVGVSVGPRGSKVSVSPTGKVTATQSIPGTGIYRQETLVSASSSGRGRKKAAQPSSVTQPAKKGGGCLKWGGIAFLMLLVLGGIGQMLPRTADAPADRSAPAVALPTWTSTPEPATVTSVPPTLEPAIIAATATPVPPTPVPEPPTATPVVLVPTEAPAAPAGPVVASDANLRAGPGTDYEVLGGAFTGESLQVVEQTADGAWLHLASGAWIAASMVSGIPAGLPLAALPERAAPVVDLAPIAPATEQPASENAFTCVGGCATPPDPSCAIKGNVNSKGELIYHAPGWRDYNRTDVKPEEGDRWFCTEAEAQAAGFRRPQNP